MKEKTKDNIHKAILSQIEHSIKTKNLQQAQVLELCRSKGYTLSQSELSRILAGKVTLGAYQVVALCDSLGLEINEVMQLKQSKVNRIEFSAESFITNPRNREMMPYLGTYSVIFRSTDMQDDKILTGRLFIYEEEEAVCQARLSLDTGEQDMQGDAILKKYRGQFFISKQLGIAYCLLTNNSWGELCLVEFKHRSFLLKQVESRVGLVLTTSSGEKKQPVIHKMLVYRENHSLSPEQERLCLNMLKLNNDMLFIEKSDAKTICETEGERELLEKVFTVLPAASYYVFSSEVLKSINKRLSNVQLSKLLAVLKEYSITEFVDRISENEDGDIFNIIRSSEERKGKGDALRPRQSSMD